MNVAFDARAEARAIGAVARYEFRMQIRRPAVWLVLGALGLYMLRLLIDSLQLGVTSGNETPAWAWLLQVLFPIGVGVLLADRFPRDRRTGVGELLNTAPPGETTRLVGKYLGATAATIGPMFLVYTAGVLWIATHYPDPGAALVSAVPAFALINLPGLLFVAAYSVCCPIVMPVPLYQFLYVGYWFWGNLMPPSIMPTLRDTWLAPIGMVAQQGIYRVVESPGTPPWQPLDAVISIALLLGLAAAALAAGAIALRWQRARV